MVRPTEQQVIALAPDRASLSAGKKLATAAPWSNTGYDDRAVWGTCRGSAKLPYQVACDTHGPAYKCSCPSRKFPCKHALGLLMLWAERSPVLTTGMPPPDVAAWLVTRSAKGASGSIAETAQAAETTSAEAAGASNAAESPSAEAAQGGNSADATSADAGRADAEAATAPQPSRDPEAASKRAEQRTERIIAGMDELDRWLGDLLRHGLGHAQAQPYWFWDSMAARLVDAQAPAAASRVRDLPGVIRTGDGWPARLLARLCRLHLLAAGWARYQSLPEAIRADLRTAAGWPWPSEQVLAGPKEHDRWYVLARSVTDEEQVRAQRTWLWGVDSGRLAVIVDFARPGMAFTWDLWPGNVLPAALARYPGTATMRVVVANRSAEPEPGGPPPGWGDLTGLAQARDRAFGTNPWLESWPVSVAGVTPDYRFGRWTVTDRCGATATLAVSDPSGWRLLALSGGRPVHLLGEWVDGAITPLGAWAEERMVVL